jgi:outer membrane receptor for ferrienterochelin and colicin
MVVRRFLVIIPSVFVLLVLLCLSAFSSAAESLDKQEDFFEMSMEELAKEYYVVSASRQSQSIIELTSAVSVITAEDIHYSGLTSIPEILQFATGMDVLRLDRNRYAVGVRGLHDMTSDRTLILVNGRSANNPMFGGSEYWHWPVLVEDIERIEIVRGPGGAAWGANAFTGVINIITKKPEDVLGTFGATTINEYGDSYSHLRFARQKGDWKWRLSAGYQENESSDEANAGRYSSIGTPVLKGLIGYNGFRADDFGRDFRLDAEAVYACSERTTLDFGVDYSHDEQGDYEFGGFFPAGHSLFETVRPFVKIEHEFENGNSGYLQWFSNFNKSRVPSLTEWTTLENDIEAQLNFRPFENHKASIGGNVRFIRISTDTHNPQDLILNGEPFDEHMAGLFLIDRWTMDEKLTLEGQIRGDWYSETQTDLSGRVSLLRAIDNDKKHVLRLSYAKAFRAPLSSLRNGSMARVSLGGGLFAFNVLEPGNLENEETWSLEAGYTGKLANDLTLRIDTYFQRFERMIGYISLPDGFGLGRALYQVSNIGGADSYGAELEIEKQISIGKISAWYAYNEIQRDDVRQNMRSYGSANHKVGLNLRWKVLEKITANLNYRYTNTTPSFVSTAPTVGQSNRFDIVISREFADGSGEISVGVLDLLQETVRPNYAMGQLTAHETPGRTFIVRLQYEF